MQTSSTSPVWATVLPYLFGILTVVTPLLIKGWLDRKRSAIEEAEAEARTDLTRTNIRNAELRDFATISESAGKLLSSLIQSGDTIHDLQKKIFDLEQERLGDDMLRLDLKKAMALLAYNNVRFSEAEHIDVKRMIQAFEELTKTSKL